MEEIWKRMEEVWGEVSSECWGCEEVLREVWEVLGKIWKSVKEVCLDVGKCGGLWGSISG